MKSRSIVIAALALSACGSSGSKVDYHADGGQTIRLNDRNNGNLTAELGASAKMPTDLPAWTPAYPGSTVMMSQVHDQAAGRGTIENVVLETPDALAKVSAFYDQQLAGAGIKPMQSMGSPEASIRIVELQTQMISLSVTKRDEGGSAISISRSPK